MNATGKTLHSDAITFYDANNTDSDGVLTVSKEVLKRLDHPQWAPTWELKYDHAFDHIPPFRHIDRGFFGDPNFKYLLSDDNVKYKEISPKLGLEVEGIQLSQLTDKQKDDLALLVEQKGVVLFKNQDFKNIGFQEIKKWGTHFGPLHVHPTSGAPLHHPELHLVFRRANPDEYKNLFADKLHNIVWHADVTYENQTPGITLFAMLQSDSTGGDTQYIDLFEAYDRLSPMMKQFLEGLKVLHTSKDQAQTAKAAGGIERKNPIDSIHPLIRYHPVLKRKFLFINRGFSRRILGMKSEESENLLMFLIKHVESCLDAHVRIKWENNAVAVWDNRRVLHTATRDWDSDDIRHAFRLTTVGERPVENAEEYENWSPELENENIMLTEYHTSLNAGEYYQRVINNK